MDKKDEGFIQWASDNNHDLNKEMTPEEWDNLYLEYEISKEDQEIKSDDNLSDKKEEEKNTDKKDNKKTKKKGSKYSQYDPTKTMSVKEFLAISPGIRKLAKEGKTIASKHDVFIKWLEKNKKIKARSGSDFEKLFNEFINEGGSK